MHQEAFISTKSIFLLITELVIIIYFSWIRIGLQKKAPLWISPKTQDTVILFFGSFALIWIQRFYNCLYSISNNTTRPHYCIVLVSLTTSIIFFVPRTQPRLNHGETRIVLRGSLISNMITLRKLVHNSWV